MDNSTSLVQVQLTSRVRRSRSGRSVPVYLSIGFGLSSLIVFLALSVIGSIWAPGSWTDRVTVGVILLGVAGIADIWSASRARYSPLGAHRQTPKALLYNLSQPRLALFLWGLDTGSAFSTYRVSAATAALFASAILGLTPKWLGLVYGLSFTAPLAALILSPGRNQRITRWQIMTLRKVQAVGASLLLAASALLFLRFL